MTRRSRSNVTVILLGLLLAATAAAAQTPARGTTAVDLSSALEATTRLASPAVVQIFTTSFKPGQGLLPQSSELVTTERASGSGVIVDAQGYIVTNAHVVSGAQ